MMHQQYNFQFEVYSSTYDLNNTDNELLQKAIEATNHAYAPYSNFFVGAAARLKDGTIVTGANQENASFPVGICAERVLLSAVTSVYGTIAIDAIAISYNKKNGESDHPISPCGVCRQSLVEFESRVKKPIRLILGGMKGKVAILDSASFLLPLNFGSEEIL